MIITFTANPSLDRTIDLEAALIRGGVQRSTRSGSQSAGKGVNVSRALAGAAVPTLALLPGDPTDPVVLGLVEDDLPHRALPIGQPLRSNITITEPGGVTTKINEPGPVLGPAQERLFSDALLAACTAGTGWVVLAGSLPPGMSAGFYADVTGRLRSELDGAAPLVAVDTSGEPLDALFTFSSNARAAAPDLIKPNAEELAELTGSHGEAELEADPRLAAAAAYSLVDAGVGAVLATLGAAGAVLVTAEGAWFATHPPVAARSTVGAGDSSLAGYLIAHSRGASPADCLREAVAYGAAAAGLPGSLIPVPAQTRTTAVRVTELPFPGAPAGARVPAASAAAASAAASATTTPPPASPASSAPAPSATSTTSAPKE
jgi:1-phosphofructokinase